MVDGAPPISDRVCGRPATACRGCGDLRSSIFRSAALAIACSKIFGSITTSLAAERFDHSAIPTATKTAKAKIPHVVIASRCWTEEPEISKLLEADASTMLQTKTRIPRSPSDKMVTHKIVTNPPSETQVVAHQHFFWSFHVLLGIYEWQTGCRGGSGLIHGTKTGSPFLGKCQGEEIPKPGSWGDSSTSL